MSSFAGATVLPHPSCTQYWWGSDHFLAAWETFLAIDFCRKSFGLHKRGEGALLERRGKSRERHKIASFWGRAKNANRIKIWEVWRRDYGTLEKWFSWTKNKVLAAAYFSKKVCDKLVEACQFHSILGNLSDDWLMLKGFDKLFISLRAGLPPFASYRSFS